MAHPVAPPPLPRRVFVVGLGTTKFEKPGSRDWDYPDMIVESVTKALNDAKLKYTDIDQAAVAYLYGSSCCGQRGLYELGLTGIPIYNVNNACASGSSAMFLMKQIIEAGTAECALAVGFEKMAKGSLESMGVMTDRAQPVEKHVAVMADTYGLEASPMTAQMFGMAAREHMEKYGTKREHFAKIAYKNHKHSVNNPDAQFQKEYSMQEIMNAKKIYSDVIGMLECSPTSDGAAAVIMCSELFLRNHPHLKAQAVHILGAQLGTDMPGAFEKSNLKMIGMDMIQMLSKKLYKQTGLGPTDCQVIECHDCFAPNELFTYEAIGLCPIGKGGEIVDRNDNTYGGRWVVNPSGGLEAKGHPIGATGVSQCVELCKQLRGIANKRQVPNCRVALQHNIGIGGAGYMAMYKLAFPTYPGSSPQQAILPSAGKGVFKSDAIFAEVEQRAKTVKNHYVIMVLLIQDGAHMIKTVNASFRFKLTNDAGQEKEWFVNAKKTPIFVGQSDEKADCELTTSEEVLFAINEGKLKPDEAFMQGKVKLKGNIMKAMKLREILSFKQKSKL